MLASDKETDLIEGCRAGDNAARQELYTRYARPMLAVCFRYVGDLDEAHDVLHDGFVKVFTHFTFRGESTLKTWLTHVMVTQSIDYLRRKKVFAPLDDETLSLYEPTDEEENWEEDHRLTQEVLLGFLAQLPDGCRTVFNLFVMEGKSHKEIARLMGIREHSSTSQLHRAKALLAQRIKAYLEECK